MDIEKQSWNDLIDRVVRNQRDHLINRKIDAGHNDTIRNASNPNKTEKEFYKLITQVFNHHEIFDYQQLSNSPDLESNEEISKWFHKDHYKKIPIKKGISAENPEIETDELFAILARQIGFNDANSVNFMIGGIGQGKTTFLCNFIYNYWSDFMDQKIIPVRINLDKMTGHKIPQFEEVNSGFNIENIIQGLRKFLIATIKKNDVLDKDQIYKLEKASSLNSKEQSIDDQIGMLERAIEILRTDYNYSPFFIIDNIDYLYHLGDRGVFADEIPESVHNAYNSIFHLVQLFLNADGFYLSRLGLNILYVIRPETLEYLESKQKQVCGPILTELAFSLDESYFTYNLARSVIVGRFEMLSEIAEHINKKRKKSDFIDQANKLKNLYTTPGKPAENSMKDLWSLSRKGLRDLVDLFGKYCWIDHGNVNREHINKRFATQYSPSIIAYILGGYRRYCQDQGNVPNLYLINPGTSSTKFGVLKKFKYPRPYTIWLKYLILAYLKKRQNILTQVKHILNVLSGKHSRAYHPDLVRYVLSVLTKSPEAEFVDYNLGADGRGEFNIYIRDISITDRGLFFLDNFALSFTFLQLSLDDWKIMIPNELIDDFSYVKPDYKYLLVDKNYRAEVNKFLTTKGLQTIKFAIFLEEALKMEKKVYPKVFSRLSGLGIDLPEEGDIVNRVKTDLETISGATISKGTKQDEEFEHNQLDEKMYRSKFEAALFKVFKYHLDFHENWYHNLDGEHFINDASKR